MRIYQPLIINQSISIFQTYLKSNLKSYFSASKSCFPLNLLFIPIIWTLWNLYFGKYDTKYILAFTLPKNNESLDINVKSGSFYESQLGSSVIRSQCYKVMREIISQHDAIFCGHIQFLYETKPIDDHTWTKSERKWRIKVFNRLQSYYIYFWGLTAWIMRMQETFDQVNGWQLAKMKKSIPDMSLPWNL